MGDGSCVGYHSGQRREVLSLIALYLLYCPRLPLSFATDLEWKVIYVGSAEDTRYDQVLEEVDVGPIPIGVNKFVLTAGGVIPLFVG